MKITDVEAIVLDTGKAYSDLTDAVEVPGIRFVSLIKVTTDSGIVGWSDIETQPHVGNAIVNAPSGGQIGFESIRAALIGENPLERDRLWQKMYRYMAYYGRQGAGIHILSGADIALWDIAGKAFDQPVWALLGAKYHDRVKAYASTILRPSPDDMKRAMARYLMLGFRAVKFGWGVFGRDPKRDVELVKAARDEAGADIDIMVDAGWYGVAHDEPYRSRAIKDWIRLVPELEELEVSWLEDFLHPENVEGYAAMADATTSLRIAAGEQHSGLPEFERLATQGKVDVLQPDLSRCGGLTVGRQIDCVPHAWLTDLLKATSLHLNAYLVNALYLEYNVATASLLKNLCTQRVEVDDGYLSVPDGPGLGVEVDEKMVEQFRVM